LESSSGGSRAVPPATVQYASHHTALGPQSAKAMPGLRHPHAMRRLHRFAPHPSLAA
jgi:hypothetical protein